MMSLVYRNTARKPARRRLVAAANSITGSLIGKIGLAFALGVVIAGAAAKVLHLLGA
jgi:hypothetical protein